MGNVIAVIVISVVVIAWAIATLHSRQQVQRARERGLWPPLGRIPTDEDVKRLAKAGERILAIKLCRQIHGMGFAESKAAVERMVEPPPAG